MSSWGNKIGIIGLGLLGGVIIREARQRIKGVRIVCLSRNEQQLKIVKDSGFIDEYTTTDYSLFFDCDVIVICTPVDNIKKQIDQLKNSGITSLITDVGSVKESIVAYAQEKGISFIGSHPMVGSEKSGFSASQEVTSEGGVCWVTPSENKTSLRTQKVMNFWESLGFKVVQMSSKEHDKIMAKVSHFPHLLSVVLSYVVDEKCRHYGGKGLKDMLRKSLSHEKIWKPIFLENTDHLVAIIDEYIQSLSQFKSILIEKDESLLGTFLERARNQNE